MNRMKGRRPNPNGSASLRRGASSSSQSTSARTVLLVDDHQVVREGLARLVDDTGTFRVIGQCENGRDALKALISSQPDLVVMDLDMPGVSGLELIKNMRAQELTTPVLVLSMHDERVYAPRALRAGAKGYIMKHEALEQLIRAMTEILEGKIFLSERMKNVAIQSFANNAAPVDLALDRLSDRELEVMRLIGNGFSTRHIAEQLHLSPKTIESYRENLKAKLGLKSGEELIQHAIQHCRLGPV